MIKVDQWEEFLVRWRYFILLLVLMLVLVVEPILFGERMHSTLFDIAYSLILICSMFALTAHRRVRWVIMVVGGISLLSTWAAHAVPGAWYHYALIASHLVGILFFSIAVYMTLDAILFRRALSMDSILGCIAGYLMLGLAWGMAYSMLHLVSAESFQLGDQFVPYVEAGQARIPVFTYYSFITLTTVGFGDMTPVSQTARTLSWLEAVTGQFYMAVIVAGIISLLATGKRKAPKTS